MSITKDLMLGIDCSTQATKVCAWSLAGELVGQAVAPLTVENPHPGWAEQNPALWWGSTRSAMLTLWETVDPHRVLAVGLACQRETFALVDHRGSYLRPAMLGLDVRAGREMDEIAAAIGREEYHRLTGKPLDTSAALARLLWLRRHQPGALLRLAQWLDVGSALAFQLTGRHATCVAGADGCGLVDLHTGTWITPFLEAAGLQETQFPALLPPGTVIGEVHRAAARQCGLPVGTPVVVAGGDGQVFAVGMAATAPWSMCLTLGTSIVLSVASPEPSISPLFRTALAAGGGYLLETVLPSGSYLLRWFSDTFTADATRNEAYWDDAIHTVPAGCEGLVTLPNWWGVRFPDLLPEARGVTLGWSHRHTQAHFYRSLLEGLGFELKRALVELQQLFPQHLHGPLHAGGGGSNSNVWCTILADVLNLGLRRNRVSESTALGAALLAGVGAGAFPDLATGTAQMVRLGRPHLPAPERQRVYEDLYEHRYLPLFDATTPLFGRE